MTAPDPLDAATYWADEARAATTARDEAIAAAVDAGAGLREVARATGLTHPTVAKIAARVAAEREARAR